MAEADQIKRAQNGDHAAWEALLQEHIQPVFRLAYLMIGDADEAEDLAQETFIHAFRAFDRFDPERQLRPWLLRITANLAHNRRRSIRRYLAAVSRVLWGAAETNQALAERSAEQWEAQTLWHAVRQLKHNDQEIIYLRYFLELSEAETADILQIATGTVKSRHSRALTRLRTIVDTTFPMLREEREP
jgi:RNA polymerase sigma-70 factor, ECF subfamily